MTIANNKYMDVPFTAHDPFLAHSKPKNWKAYNPNVNVHGNKKTNGPDAITRTVTIKK
jgi:hypothetical protein